MRFHLLFPALSFLVPVFTLLPLCPGRSAEAPGQRFEWTARASELDPAAQAHPEIQYVFESKGKPADIQHASVDTRVKAQGKLAIWLMGHSAGLFERLNRYGIHSIRVHYANGWFGQFGNLSPSEDGHVLGNIRLEAATGQDFSPHVKIPKADGMMERAYRFILWLTKKNPEGKWEQFLSADGKGLDWEKVIITGSSHGSTTAARFAKHQKVGRVVMFCGPRDQYEQWQKLPSATPSERFFGFSHVLDGGWSGDHYCRSWELLGLHEHGRIVSIDEAKPPYERTRRLITAADVKGDDKRAHSCVVPGSASPKDGKGAFLFEDVWHYLFNQPTDQCGTAVDLAEDCERDQAPASKQKK